jgi:tetratricopeptide (TPR) repeat protein
MKLLLMLCILCACLSPAALRADDGDVLNCVARGSLYLAKDRLKEALGEFNNAVELARVYKLEEKFPVVYFNRARIYERLNKREEAIADYTRAVELDKNYMLCYYNRGLLYQRMGKLDPALLDYNTMLAMDPKQIHAHNNRGLIFLQKGEVVQAIGDFSTAIQIDSSTFNVHFNRALAYLRIRDYARAKLDLFEEKEKYPHSVSAGLLYFAVENYLNRKYDAVARTINQLHDLGYDVGPEFVSDVNTALGKQVIVPEAPNYGLLIKEPGKSGGDASE